MELVDEDEDRSDIEVLRLGMTAIGLRYNLIETAADRAVAGVVGTTQVELGVDLAGTRLVRAWAGHKCQMLLLKPEGAHTTAALLLPPALW
ncbi:hypothetical protein ILT44_15890 [Microvirga sp. BT689]|uniref:hypothetical protein n=1 Tax=Microvirga arvi TaxID=2778731 RepID=UPI00195221EC|nr:hypothetical protein [Microvirga arvi]MBM6581679.1 hypothetical protein [Microvirga arvi]